MSFSDAVLIKHSYPKHFIRIKGVTNHDGFQPAMAWAQAPRQSSAAPSTAQPTRRRSSPHRNQLLSWQPRGQPRLWQQGKTLAVPNLKKRIGQKHTARNENWLEKTDDRSRSNKLVQKNVLEKSQKNRYLLKEQNCHVFQWMMSGTRKREDVWCCFFLDMWIFCFTAVTNL